MPGAPGMPGPSRPPAAPGPAPTPRPPSTDAHTHHLAQRPASTADARIFASPRVDGREPGTATEMADAAETRAQALIDDLRTTYDPESTPTEQLQTITDTRGQPRGCITRFPADGHEFAAQLRRAVELGFGRDGQVVNLSEFSDHGPGTPHHIDEFPIGKTIECDGLDITRESMRTRPLRRGQDGRTIRAEHSVLRVEDRESGSVHRVHYHDIRNFSDGSTPPTSTIDALHRYLNLGPQDALPVFNCEMGLGRSAMMAAMHDLGRHVASENQAGRRVTPEALQERLREFVTLAREQRGGALFPDDAQNRAVLDYGQRLLDAQQPARARPASRRVFEP